jgi:hypothetical protein
VKLPANAEILETTVIEVPGCGSLPWFAGIRFKIPGQGGYDRPLHDDMFRWFASQVEAKEWIADKTKLQEKT